MLLYLSISGCRRRRLLKVKEYLIDRRAKLIAKLGQRFRKNIARGLPFKLITLSSLYIGQCMRGEQEEEKVEVEEREMRNKDRG